MVGLTAVAAGGTRHNERNRPLPSTPSNAALIATASQHSFSRRIHPPPDVIGSWHTPAQGDSGITFVALSLCQQEATQASLGRTAGNLLFKEAPAAGGPRRREANLERVVLTHPREYQVTLGGCQRQFCSLLFFSLWRQVRHISHPVSQGGL